MDPAILISLIIPVYNSENTLAVCLDSIVHQPYQAYEIVIVNDGSTDHSQEIINRYVIQYPRIIKFIQIPSSGIGYARNVGIDMASGQYLAFVDSDDYVTSNYFEVIVDKLTMHEPDLLIFRYDRVYKRRPNLLEKIYSFSQYKLLDTPVNIDSHPEIIYQTENAAWIKVVKKEMIKGEGSISSKVKLGVDMPVSLYWLLNAKKVVYSNEILYKYILQNNYVSTSTQHISDLLVVMKAICEEYKRQGKFEHCYSELEILFIKHLLISNMRRMKSSAMKNKYALFSSLRAALKSYFPNYNRNSYLKKEPFYIKLAVLLSWYFPRIFRIIL